MDIKRFFRSASDSILSFLYPARCPRCDRVLPFGREKGQMLCEHCQVDLPYVKEPFCMRCGRQLAKEDEQFCTQCRKWHHPFESGRSLFVYDEDMKKMMYRFKYSNRREYAEFFAETVKRKRMEWLDLARPGLILPVPMFQKKQKKRGYNQAEDLAKAMSLRLGIPMEPDILVRAKDTAPLKGQTKQEREKNLKDVFSVDVRRLIPILERNEPLRFLIVDDIFTTGSTADGVSKALTSAVLDLCGEKPKIYIFSVCIGADT